jgi:TatD DNase family protein
MTLIDTHAHLDQEEFAEDRERVIEQAVQVGITHLVAVGIGAESSQQCLKLATTHVQISAAVGIQPNYCAEAVEGDWDRIVALSREQGVVAIGETGLDRHWDFSPFPLQQDYFDRHLRLARETGLPFIVHTRKSDADVLEMLREARCRGPLHGVMHSFTGNQETAEECMELGLYISFAGMVTFKKADDLRAVARQIPEHRLLIETDSPYLAPHPLRSHRNEPAYLVHTAECLAAERGVTLEDFCRITSENAQRLFPFDIRRQ